ncbi:SMC5-SMC6 complex localization factor protein 1 [Bombina bombina]|uniref:SMC5-SMC6 complex localization factor protein 1 n=1 Tax=Bombina bombina TaxID=8345 RepID=UPI00235B143D|nr:SMC5-SMC6 complex localization factor protein 1 [Bombina bombina]
MEAPLNKRIVQLTGFRDAEKDALIEQLFKLDCIFIDSEIFANCTHLIAKKPCRSEKWLAACATGKWVLTKDYIIKSVESGRWLDEITYEWGYNIEKDSHYSPQMQSAPKRWREQLTCSGALGAFSRWKVVLLFKDGRKEREAFIRVLKAGQANICNLQDSNEEITHVFTSNKGLCTGIYNKLFKGIYHSVQYLGKYLLEEPIVQIPEEVQAIESFQTNDQETCKENLTDKQFADIRHSIWKHFCYTQAIYHKCIKQDVMGQNKFKMKPFNRSQVTLNRIECLLDGQFLAETFEELHRLLPVVPPVHFIQILLKHLIQGNVVKNCFGRFFDILYSLLKNHPPWESPHMLQYYLDFLQCPICNKGSWSFIEMLIRSCFDEKLCLCHQSSGLEIDPDNCRAMLSALLKFIACVMQEEAKALSLRLCENIDFHHHRALHSSIIVNIFWSESRTQRLLTDVMITLTDFVLRGHKDMCRKENVFLQEIVYYLNGMLGSAVEYWILLGFYLDKNMIHQVTNDLAFYICVPCEDFSLEEKQKFICSITSPWLQMLVAEAVFKTFCMTNKLQLSSEPLSLEKLICKYIPSLWQVGTCGNEKVQKFKGKRKIGQRPCLESQRALLMLNGENQNPDEVLLDLPVCPKLRRRTDGGSVCSKENLPGIRQNAKGETALHTACINNKVKKLILLLSLPGTDINVKDYAGWTPLHEACNHGSTECVQEILQRCPEVDLLSHVDGVTPLHDALRNGHVEIGKLLLQYGGPAVLQCKDSDGRFPLDYITSAQLKKELFDIVQINETIEDFHKRTAQEFHNFKIEFSAFLLSRMLLNLCSLYVLPLSSIDAKTCRNAANFIRYARSKETTISFNCLIVERCIEDFLTMQKLSDLLQAIPESVRHSDGFLVQFLLATLQNMSSSSSLVKIESE